MRSIQDWGQKIKSVAEGAVLQWGLITLVVLMSIVSFGLGRLSMLEAVRPVVSVGQANPLSTPRGMYIGGLYVAAATGEVYYFPWCGAVEKIAPANRRWFKTEKDAKAAGYRAAKNCKGLVARD